MRRRTSLENFDEPAHSSDSPLVLAVGFVTFCLVDLARAKEVRYLPKWAWAILCLGVGLTIPFGGITYLVFGRVRRPRPA
jgi:hypothetical protein